jgi:hypothetical protein
MHHLRLRWVILQKGAGALAAGRSATEMRPHQGNALILLTKAATTSGFGRLASAMIFHNICVCFILRGHPHACGMAMSAHALACLLVLVF